MAKVDLATINANTKQYEIIALKADPDYGATTEAINIVKDFIIKKQLIVYGGTAIDFALRLRGDQIYPDDMLAIPDLDMYSPNNVADAYELANILYKSGFSEVRAINALHIKTMKVDIARKHWVADLSYVPASIFNKLPWFDFNGMRVIDPIFQRVDLHISLVYPYSDAPRESIFHRWSKDIKRYNKLWIHYPINQELVAIKSNYILDAPKNLVLSGFAAYAVIYREFVRLMGAKYNTADFKNHKKNLVDRQNIIPAEFKGPSPNNNLLSFSAPLSIVEFIDFNIDKARKIICDFIGQDDPQIKSYESYFSLMLPRTEITISKKQKNKNQSADTKIKYIIYNCANKLTAVNSAPISENYSVRFVNVQWLLWYFISLYNMHSDKMPEIRDIYLHYYLSTLEMIRVYEAQCKMENKLDEFFLSPFAPSIKIYGKNNISLSRELLINKVKVATGDEPVIYAPTNYYPARGKEAPEFDPSKSPFFCEEGKPIIETN